MDHRGRAERRRRPAGGQRTAEAGLVQLAGGWFVRIAQVASCHESTPPRGYGSINRIVGDLTESLVARGHEVTLFATGNSRTAATLCWTFPVPLPGELNVGREWLHSIRSLQRCHGFDIVHNHNFFSGSALS